MAKTRLLLVGGFLGAGKTTLLLRAAQRLSQQGYCTGIVTNDQGQQLVDTAFLADQTLPVQEVSGGCFCCRFPDLLTSLRQLRDEIQPDVILAEPVGSCTDLVATVLRPLLQHYPGEFEVAPLTVLLDPLRELGGFEATVDYLYQRQLMEAEFIALNKSDMLNETTGSEMRARLQRLYPDAEVLSVSARTGDGVDAWLNRAMAAQAPKLAALDIDYATYAAAEASLGWLNTRLTLTGTPTLGPGAWMTQVMTRLSQSFAVHRIAIAHLKLHVRTAHSVYKASLTHSGQPIVWDSATRDTPVEQAAVILNARVNATPEHLQTLVRQAIADACASLGVTFSVSHHECFSPLPPEPTFRLA